MSQLLQDLTRLGDELIVGELPAAHEVQKVLGALVNYIETGTLEAPERAPSAVVAQELHEDKAEIARLQAQVRSLQEAQVQPPPPAPEPTPAPEPPVEPVVQPVTPPAPEPPAEPVPPTSL